MIFSTVFGPHEPALTVGSLAITATGRPSIVAEPGDDAVGAEPVLLPVGQQRVLDERALVEQPRDALAHGQLALLGRLLRGGARARPRAARSSASWRRRVGHGRTASARSAGGARHRRLGRQRPGAAAGRRPAARRRRAAAGCGQPTAATAVRAGLDASTTNSAEHDARRGTPGTRSRSIAP